MTIMTKTVKALIIANVALFILVHLVPGFGWLTFFGLVPRDVLGRFRLWQLATYMFLHAGLWHLVLNMLMLWFFGPAIERSWSRKEFLSFYFFTGIGAGLCSYLSALGSAIPVIGASGAIFGLLVAYAMLFPQTTILLFFVFPMKIKHAVLVLAGINLLGALSAPGAGIAYFAHLGGGLFGYLYVKSEWIKRQISYLDFSSLKIHSKKRKISEKQRAQKNLDRKVNVVLDKISKRGMGSLSREEKRILELKSRKG